MKCFGKRLVLPVLLLPLPVVALREHIVLRAAGEYPLSFSDDEQANPVKVEWEDERHRSAQSCISALDSHELNVEAAIVRFESGE